MSYRTYERVVNITGQPDFSIPMRAKLQKCTVCYEYSYNASKHTV